MRQLANRLTDQLRARGRWLLDMLDDDGDPTPLGSASCFEPRPLVVFRPTYPGSQVELAWLGDITVGGVCADGTHGAWICHLPTGGAPAIWRRADSVDEAKRLILAAISDWVFHAGLMLREVGYD